MKTIWIRADASSKIGSGHIMRCMALAEELREAGADARFICRDLRGALIRYINSRGFVVEPISASSEEWDADEDSIQTREIIEKYGMADWLIVDLLNAGVEYDKALRGVTRKILSVDDHADRERDCDIIVSPHFFPDSEERYKKITSSKCIALAGLTYALIRKEFRIASEELTRHEYEIKKILISFGGGEYAGITDKAVEAVTPLCEEGITVDVVTGAYDQTTGSIVKSPKTNLFFHSFVDNMPQLISKADLVIGAYGVSMAERMLLGAVSIMIAVAKIQVAPANALADAGYAIYLGDKADVTPEQILSAINELKNDPYRVRAISKSIRERVDGLGAQRVVKSMGLYNQ